MAARILIADDSRAVRTSLRQLLESQSHDWKVCGLAANGRQAVKKAMESQPDLIILDLRMRLVDGLRAAIAIAKYLPRVPILMYTLYKSLELDSKARKAGIRKVIAKSEPEALLKAVGELLPKKQMTAFGG